MRPAVLHVIPHLWSGAGGVVTRLCETQRRHGPVAIVTAGRLGEQPDWPTYRTRLRRAGVSHHTIDFFHRGEATFWSSATALAAVLRDVRPAVIHAHAGVPTCGAVVARAMSGHAARVIGQCYSWRSDRPAWMDQQDLWGFSQADRVICSAHAYHDLLRRYGVSPRQLRYLPWGLPLEQLPWRGAPPGDLAPIIGFVGRLEPRKGQLDLVKAFSRVRRVCPTARLELVGPVADESYAVEIRKAIASARLQAAVTLTGNVRDVTTYLRRWNLFVSLSADEGQGLAVLEAMAVGVPVLARAVAGLSDFLVDGSTGLVIARRSAPGVAAAIVNALASATTLRAVSRAARRLVERKYAWRQTVDAFERLYWA